MVLRVLVQRDSAYYLVNVALLTFGTATLSIVLPYFYPAWAVEAIHGIDLALILTAVVRRCKL